MTRIQENELFIRNIFDRGPMQGHAFVARPLGPGVAGQDADITLSERPVEDWVGPSVKHYEAQMRMIESTGTDLVPTVKLATGTHICAAAFGSPVKTFEDDNACALPFVNTPDEADQIKEPGLWDSPIFERIFAWGHRMQEELGPDVYLGPCDMQTGFDTACLIWDKTELFMAMMDPEECKAVERLSAKCASFFKKLVTELRKEFPRMSPCHCPTGWTPPERGPWVSNDECGAINHEMFRQYLLPELIDLSETFGSLGMHCCADAEHQFSLFQDIPNFYGFNRVAARQGWDTLLEHFDGTEKSPVMVLNWVDDQDMAGLIQQAPEGMRFIFQHDTDDPDEARRWIELGRNLSPRS